MILISHRGNTTGPNPERENEPSYLIETLRQGYNVELDLWIDDHLMVGHNKPQYPINWEFLFQPKLWIHCKDYQTLKILIPHHKTLNFFYHTDEDYVLTSKGYIWAYPNNPGNKYTICVMPEWNNFPTKGFEGICSDFIEKYNDKDDII